jgi:hypothetical protein
LRGSRTAPFVTVGMSTSTAEGAMALRELEWNGRGLGLLVTRDDPGVWSDIVAKVGGACPPLYTGAVEQSLKLCCLAHDMDLSHLSSIPPLFQLHYSFTPVCLPPMLHCEGG